MRGPQRGERVAAAGHPGLLRVVAPQHQQPAVRRGVLEAVAHLLVVGAVGVLRARRDLAVAVVAVVVQVAAEQVEQPRPAAGVAQVGVPHPGAVRLEDRLVAVGVDRVPQLLGEQVERLVPGNRLELSVAAAAGALQRGLDAVGGVDPLAHVAPAHAGPDLTRQQAVVAGVVGQHPDDRAVLDLQPQRAAGAAVDDARRPHGAVRGGAVGGGRGPLRFGRSGAGTEQGAGAAGRGRPGQEGTTGDGARDDRHGGSPRLDEGAGQAPSSTVLPSTSRK